jgi:AbrB family looped-hinge helix DNA binding protein
MERQMPTLKTRITEGGRIVIPAEYRKALGLQVGDEVMLTLDDGELRIMTIEASIRRAQEIVSRYVPEGRSLVDEFIAERRAEAARE